MAIHTLNRLGFIATQHVKCQNRSLFYWLTVIFNRVDQDRIKEVGPNLACAEWLLKNGAYVRWKGYSEELTDYNAIPSKGNAQCIEAVNADNAGICDVGFPYFKGCRHIKEVKLKNCKYINNKAMPLLSLLKDSLINLEIVNCKSVDDEGLRDLKVLKNLQALKIEGLSYTRDKSSVQKELVEALPNCQIDFH